MLSDTEILVAVRTHGAPVVTTGNDNTENRVLWALKNLGTPYTVLDGSIYEDVGLLKIIPTMTKPGVLVVRNFHLLDPATHDAFAQYMKCAADSRDPMEKVIAFGNQNTASILLGFASDLCLRLTVLKD